MTPAPIPRDWKAELHGVTKDLLAKQALEISDLARKRGDLALALEALAFIASLQDMLDE